MGNETAEKVFTARAPISETWPPPPWRAAESFADSGRALCVFIARPLPARDKAPQESAQARALYRAFYWYHVWQGKVPKAARGAALAEIEDYVEQWRAGNSSAQAHLEYCALYLAAEAMVGIPEIKGRR